MENLGRHDIESVLQHDGIVGHNGLHLCAASCGQRHQRKARIAAGRDVVDGDALRIVEPYPDGGEAGYRPGPHLEAVGLARHFERLDFGRTGHGKGLPLAIAHFEADRTVVASHKKETREGPAVGPLNTCRAPILGRSPFERHEILLLQGHEAPIGLPGFEHTVHLPAAARLDNRPAETREIGVHRHIAHAATAILRLQPAAHILGENISFDERVAQKSDTNRTSQREALLHGGKQM